jgi:tRNA dimethylallyltransferase
MTAESGMPRWKPFEFAIDFQMSNYPPLIVIVGPTAVGKSLNAIQLAQILDGEIVSADSRLFYKGMDIGTAKPSSLERSLVPHHLIDVSEPDQTWSITVFQQAAREAIDAIHIKGRLPFLVGGSGQYIHAVVKGWTPPAVKPNLQMRRALEELNKSNGPVWLHDRLALLDPAAAEKIDARNVRRTIRALEVILSSGHRFSEQGGQALSPYSLIQIGLFLPRADLYKRIDERIDAMFEHGLLREVKELLDQGYSPELPTMSAIGYREAVQVLQGRMTEEEAKTRMRKSTRVFVRRQANWFKQNDNDITWFHSNTPAGEIANHIKKCLTKNNNASH